MLRIVCEKDFLFGAGGSFTCTLYWQTDEGAFPSDDWTDFSGVLLRWWTDAYFALEYSSAAEFLFMDGPYSIRSCRTGDRVRCSFLRSGMNVLPDQEIELGELRDALLCAVRRLKSGLTQAGRDEEAARAGELMRRLKIASGSLHSPPML